MNIIFIGEFFEVNEGEMDRFEELFPGVNIEQELKRAEGWLRANPNRRKKSYSRFLFNWLSKSHRDLLARERPTRQQQTMQRVTEEVIRGAQELGAGGTRRQLARSLLQPVPHRS